MPTLIDLDGHQHGVFATSQAGSGFIGTYDAIGRAAGISLDATIKRHILQAGTLKIVEDGTTATNVRRTIAAGNKIIVASFYVRCAAAPSGTSAIFQLPGPTNNGVVSITSAGLVQARVQTGTGRNSAASIVDGLWHRIDLKFDASGTTYTLDVQVDGTAITQATLASQTAADITGWVQGSLTNADNATIWLSDAWVSATSGDYPMGEHLCMPLFPTGEGTETLGTTNKIQDEAAGQTNLYQKVDDWLAAAGPPGTSEFVTYASTTLGDAASNFAEFTLSDPIAAIAVVDVLGIIAGFANGTGADTADTQVLTAHAGTLIDHIGNLIDYSGSATVLGYYRQKLARPAGGWDATKLAAAIVQWGRSTDTNAIPRLKALMLEYGATVGSQSGAAALTGTGSLSATAVREQPGSASPAGAGDLSASGLAVSSGAAAIAGAGALSASGLAEVFGSAALTGSGGSSIAAVREVPGSAALAGSGAASASGLQVSQASSALSGVGSLAASGETEASGAAADLAGSGSLQATGRVEKLGAAALAAAGALAATGLRERLGAAALAGAGSASATGLREVPALAALSGAGALAGSGLQIALAAAALEGEGLLAAAGFAEAFGSADLEGEGSLRVTLSIRLREAERWRLDARPRWLVRAAE